MFAMLTLRKQKEKLGKLPFTIATKRIKYLGNKNKNKQMGPNET